MNPTDKAIAVGINHVALEVDDIEEALTFYGELFELRLRGRHPGMAFIDLGDQFINLSEKRSQKADTRRHFGLVVKNREAMRRAVERLGCRVLASPGRGGLDFLDPWGNHVQVVEYENIQFTKTDAVLHGMGLDGLGKSEAALSELRDKQMVH